MEEYNGGVTVISLILSSSLLTAFCTGIFNKRKNDDDNYLKYITEERRKWREEIRIISKSLSENNLSSKEVEKIYYQLSVSINPNEENDRRILIYIGVFRDVLKLRELKVINDCSMDIEVINRIINKENEELINFLFNEIENREIIKKDCKDILAEVYRNEIKMCIKRGEKVGDLIFYIKKKINEELSKLLKEDWERVKLEAGNKKSINLKVIKVTVFIFFMLSYPVANRIFGYNIEKYITCIEILLIEENISENILFILVIKVIVTLRNIILLWIILYWILKLFNYALRKSEKYKRIKAAIKGFIYYPNNSSRYRNKNI